MVVLFNWKIDNIVFKYMEGCCFFGDILKKYYNLFKGIIFRKCFVK